jgi:hypothetical protein
MMDDVGAAAAAGLMSASGSSMDAAGASSPELR